MAGVNAFAFIEYVGPEGAAAAVQASPRIYGNARLRVERKESADPSARLNNFIGPSVSPRSPYLGDSHDQMAMLYQRGLYAGLAQAAQAQAMPPPVWAGFPYCQPYDPSQYGQYNSIPSVPSDDNASAGLQPHPNTYATHAMSQVQYTQPPSQYIHYPQQPPRASYQWPPAGSGGEDIHAAQNMGVEQTR